jgi:hypothetical protein
MFGQELAIEAAEVRLPVLDAWQALWEQAQIPRVEGGGSLEHGGVTRPHGALRLRLEVLDIETQRGVWAELERLGAAAKIRGGPTWARGIQQLAQAQHSLIQIAARLGGARGGPKQTAHLFHWQTVIWRESQQIQQCPPLGHSIRVADDEAVANPYGECA